MEFTLTFSLFFLIGCKFVDLIIFLFYKVKCARRAPDRQLVQAWKNVHWNSQQVCTYEKEVVRGNQALYMTQVLLKAIMRRPELETKYFELKKKTLWKPIKDSKITAAGFTRKKGKISFKIWICHLLLIIK